MTEATRPDTVNADALPEIWRYVAIDDFSLPASPVIQSAKTFVDHVFERLGVRRRKDSEPVRSDEELGGIDANRIKRIVPQPDWHCAADVLEKMLTELFASGGTPHRVVVLTAPPWSGYRNILEELTLREQYSEILPPTAEQVFSNDGQWLKSFRHNRSILVYPFLERTFFRHAGALDLIRRFMREAASGNHRPVILGCDSWSWAFLEPLWEGRKPLVITLQTFNEEQIGQYFLDLADSGGSKGVFFRHATTGNIILSAGDGSGSTPQTDNFLQMLASKSRGNIGVATAIWKASLMIERNNHKETAKEAAGLSRSRQTIWVRSFEKIVLPSVPSQNVHDSAILLHTILLHGSLDVGLLHRLLPRMHTTPDAVLSLLEERGLVEEGDGTVSVSARGYPAVRQFLKSEGYLVDAF
ncbi:MAG: hypothetical protein C1942_04475 [Prosthecochloris sp.]|uniref:hypothetical protein n=1 Tax=Prosthecochloris sp. TaxID=290513 RepID=UPI0013C7941F|nr:hypothetical protein [Prosthecochloris sp.]NEX11942.1 hypothetical protein [Prosthecochloris sp.]